MGENGNDGDERLSGETKRQVRYKFTSDYLKKAVHANSRDNSDYTSVHC